MRRASAITAMMAGGLGLVIGGFAVGRATAASSGQTILVAGAALAALLAIVATWVTFRLSAAMGALTEQLEVAAQEDGGAPPVRSVGVSELDQAAGRVLERLRVERARADEARQEVVHSAAQLGEMLEATLDLGRILRLVLDVVTTRLDATTGAIFTFAGPPGAPGEPGPRDRLEGQVTLGLPIGSLRQQELRVGSGLAGWVAVTGEPAVIPSLAGPTTQPPEPDAHTALAVPIRVRNRTYAVLALYGRESGIFRAADLEQIQQFVNRAGVGIENVLRHQEAQRRSITDSLTGVWNRRYFELRAREELERSIRFDRPFSIVMADLDNFKDVNDRFGHRSGDEVLVAVAQRMTHDTRELDTVARYGGEEFVLLLPETDTDGAVTVAEKLRRAISTRPIHVTDVGELAVTISIGVASYPANGNSVAAVLREADEALYAAKHRGKNRVVAAGQGLAAEDVG